VTSPFARSWLVSRGRQLWTVTMRNAPATLRKEHRNSASAGAKSAFAPGRTCVRNTAARYSRHAVRRTSSRGATEEPGASAFKVLVSSSRIVSIDRVTYPRPLGREARRAGAAYPRSTTTEGAGVHARPGTPRSPHSPVAAQLGAISIGSGHAQSLTKPVHSSTPLASARGVYTRATLGCEPLPGSYADYNVDDAEGPARRGFRSSRSCCADDPFRGAYGG
jgi:hypothetical protein